MNLLEGAEPGLKIGHIFLHALVGKRRPRTAARLESGHQYLGDDEPRALATLRRRVVEEDIPLAGPAPWRITVARLDEPNLGRARHRCQAFTEPAERTVEAPVRCSACQIGEDDREAYAVLFEPATNRGLRREGSSLAVAWDYPSGLFDDGLLQAAVQGFSAVIQTFTDAAGWQEPVDLLCARLPSTSERELRARVNATGVTWPPAPAHELGSRD